MRIGVLALQGDFEAHVRGYAALGVEVTQVRRVAELAAIDGLVMPGGESTTLLKLMEDEPWFDELAAFHAAGKGLFATCAGAILLAREVTGPEQRSIGLLDLSVRRNGYGRQIDSFEVDLRVLGEAAPLKAVFIRAPLFQSLGAGVDVLARHANEPVLVQQGAILAATFHPELTDDRRLQRRFLDLVQQPVAPASSRAVASQMIV